MHFRASAASCALGLFIVGVAVGCDPLGPSSGCEKRMATDVAFGGIGLESARVPCTSGVEAPRGSDPHLIFTLQSDGESKPFLVAVKVDGQLRSLIEVRCDAFVQTTRVDAGTWEASDSNWHDAEVVVDPLNLFKETNEANNRGRQQVRITEPDARIDAEASGFIVPHDAGGDGFTLVDRVAPGTPVNVRMRMIYGGPYVGITRSVHSGAALSASDVLQLTCPDYGNRNDFVTRWTPPAPGDYDVEFRIQPMGATPDANASNDVVIKHLLVSSTVPRRVGVAR